MNKTLIASLAMLVVVGGLAVAFGPRWSAQEQSQYGMGYGMGHGMLYARNGPLYVMQDIVENGTYADFVQAREDYGRIGPYWVTDNETFADWQEMHDDCPMS